ncbi:hypothetical protein PF005_g30241 [Phytophthora fragariae]|uniref:Resolvase HTH domain-containing protein n=2 Tax=Phytophthora fragariae TaxID=53985 RepID=A0A6A3VCF8_9STRA|nr:hypothetical protein PF005_g30241 [Phytophthora fragariae]
MTTNNLPLMSTSQLTSMSQREARMAQDDIEEAYSLRRSRMTNAAIADRMGLSKDQVYRAIKKRRL